MEAWLPAAVRAIVTHLALPGFRSPELQRDRALTGGRPCNRTDAAAGNRTDAAVCVPADDDRQLHLPVAGTIEV